MNAFLITKKRKLNTQWKVSSRYEKIRPYIHTHQSYYTDSIYFHHSNFRYLHTIQMHQQTVLNSRYVIFWEVCLEYWADLSKSWNAINWYGVFHDGMSIYWKTVYFIDNLISKIGGIKHLYYRYSASKSM